VSRTDIFLSYARDDRSTARIFAERLEGEGFHVWWDASLHSGETFDEVIEQRLRAAKAVVVLWSPRSVASRWVRAEATLADRRNKLAPAIIEACDRPIIFELTHAADLCGWEGDTSDMRWRTFVNDLNRLVQRDQGAPAAAAPALPQQAAIQQLRPCDAARPPVANVTQAEVHCLEPEGGSLQDQPIVIDCSGLKIGRAAPADIVISHRSISREHCIVGLAADELLVTDLNSTNGTFIDGERVRRATVLPVGSVLRIGEVSLRHAISTHAEAQPHGAMPNVEGAADLDARRLAAIC
jgi:hypothetical protein